MNTYLPDITANPPSSPHFDNSISWRTVLPKRNTEEERMVVPEAWWWYMVQSSLPLVKCLVSGKREIHIVMSGKYYLSIKLKFEYKLSILKITKCLSIIVSFPKENYWIKILRPLIWTYQLS